MADILTNPVFATIGIAIICGLIGPFVLWQRMAYFGDSLVHSALLGVALSLVFKIDMIWGIVAISALFALLLTSLEKIKLYSSDTILGIIAHSALALGIVAVGIAKGNSDIHLEELLVGDILSVGSSEIKTIYISAILISGFIAYNWRKLLLVSMNVDVAKVQQINVDRIKLAFMLAIALTVAISIKIVGILLITSMLIIPAAIARIFAASPLSMVFYAMFITLTTALPGVIFSQIFALPAGATIVVLLSILFFISLIFRKS